MKLISIVTPSYKPVPEYLVQTWDSISTQELPAGWALEWVIQEDGNTGILADLLPSDPRIKIGTGRKGGVALTRNMALARTRGSLIKNVDADDILAPGVIARDIQVLTENPHVQWTTSKVLDLLPDGSTVAFDKDPKNGILEKGSIFEHWISHNYRAPVHPTTICIRRNLVVALGGWMGIPGSDDTGMLIPASVISDGYFHAEVGLLYRKWPGQETSSPDHYNPDEWRLRMSLIRDRAEALRTGPSFPV